MQCWQTISVLLQYPEYVRQFEVCASMLLWGCEAALGWQAEEFVKENFMHFLIGNHCPPSATVPQGATPRIF